MAVSLKGLLLTALALIRRAGPLLAWRERSTPAGTEAHKEGHGTLSAVQQRTTSIRTGQMQCATRAGCGERARQTRVPCPGPLTGKGYSHDGPARVHRLSARQRVARLVVREGPAVQGVGPRLHHVAAHGGGRGGAGHLGRRGARGEWGKGGCMGGQAWSVTGQVSRLLTCGQV